MAGWGTLQEMDQPDGPAWIQAIWSVVAVFLAVFAPMWHATISDNAAYRRSKKLLAEVVKTADSLLAEARTAAASDFRESHRIFLETPLETWLTARDALTAFPVTNLRTAEEVADLMTIRKLMARSATRIERADRPGSEPWQYYCEIRDMADNAQPSIERLIEGR